LSFAFAATTIANAQMGASPSSASPAAPTPATTPHGAVAPVDSELSLTTAVAVACPPKMPNVNLTPLMNMCHSNFAEYLNQLENLKYCAEKWLKSQTGERVTELYLESQPLLVFLAVTWPEILNKHYPFWDSYKDIAQAHKEARAYLVDSDKSPNEKNIAVENFKNWIVHQFADHHEVLRGRINLLTPLNRLVRCYDSHVRATATAAGPGAAKPAPARKQRRPNSPSSKST